VTTFATLKMVCVIIHKITRTISIGREDMAELHPETQGQRWITQPQD